MAKTSDMRVNVVTAIDETSVRLLDALAASRKLGIAQVCINEALAQLKGDDLSEREQAVKRSLIHAMTFDGWEGRPRFVLFADSVQGERFVPEDADADEASKRDLEAGKS